MTVANNATAQLLGVTGGTSMRRIYDSGLPAALIRFTAFVSIIRHCHEPQRTRNGRGKYGTVPR